MFVRVTAASGVTSDGVNGELLRAETTRPGPGWMRAHVVTLPARTVVRERLRVLPGSRTGVDSGFGVTFVHHGAPNPPKPQSTRKSFGPRTGEGTERRLREGWREWLGEGWRERLQRADRW
jgi:hypothetical protein